MTAGQKLRKWREEQGLEQRPAAKRAGISQATWQAVETDRVKRIGLDVARAIVEVTAGAVTLDDLTVKKRTRSRPSTPPPPKRRAA